MRAPKGFAKQHNPSPHRFNHLKLYYNLKPPNSKPIVMIHMGHDFEDGGFVSPVFCCVLKTDGITILSYSQSMDNLQIAEEAKAIKKP